MSMYVYDDVYLCICLKRKGIYYCSKGVGIKHNEFYCIGRIFASLCICCVFIARQLVIILSPLFCMVYSLVICAFDLVNDQVKYSLG